MNTVSLCIATYRRPERLAVVLDDLTRQTRPPDEVVVVDNDAAGSARVVVEQRLLDSAPFPIHYAVQPQKNISLTRNKTVELAGGDWLAFIDDDERAPPAWLAQLMDAAVRFTADGVLGPVDPVVPSSAPLWIRRGHFYDFPRMATGTVIPPNRLRFGNVLVKGSWLRGGDAPFDPALGLTGGEDGDLLSRLVQRGARLVWCDEAIVSEPVEPSRLSLHWLLRRALSGGQDFARHALAGRYGAMSTVKRAQFFLRALAQALAAAGLTLIVWPLGRHHAARWLTTLSANVGKLSVFWGWRYREYA
ncbi:MAG TPA: glycosyltransferase family 2 protein [Steroidobacteraceae bacterium]|jgi:succinoglycan biosynthesis protein ExoM